MSLPVLIGANLVLLFLIVTGEANSKCNYDPATRIVGGERAAEGEFPFIVRVIDGFINCAGSIIDERHIITAAHCMKSRSPDSKNVYTGCHDRNKCSGRYNIESFVKHQKFDMSRVAYKYDIALLRTSRPIQFRPGNKLFSVGKIELADSLSGDVRNEYVVAGWGNQKFNATTRDSILHKVTIPNIPVNICARSYEGADSNVICAGRKGKDACQGDSGGPLFVKVADRSHVLVGLVSAGKDCGSEAGGVYTRVAIYRQWIREGIQFLSDRSRLEARWLSLFEPGARKNWLQIKV